MATNDPGGRLAFSSPSMRARAALARGLALTDELERAWFRRDSAAVRRLCAELRDQANRLVHAASDAEGWDAPADPDEYQANLDAWSRPADQLGPQDQAHPMTESEKRAAWGDR